MNPFRFQNAIVAASLAAALTLVPSLAHAQSGDATVVAGYGSLDGNSPVSQTVRPGSHYQLHQVRLQAGQTYTIAMNSTDFDSYLFVLNPATGEVLARDDDSGGNLNALIRFTAPHSGTFTLM